MNYEDIVKKIFVTTDDNITCEVPLVFINEYEYFTNQLDNHMILQENESSEEGCYTFKIPFSSEDLNVLIEYTKKILIEKAESNEEKQKELIDNFNQLIGTLSKTKLDHILNIVDFMIVNNLLDRICDGIALEIRSKTPEQIRAKYGLKDDLSEEDRKMIEKDFGFLLNIGKKNEDVEMTDT